jgi:asparagine synthase (glutamine-hydrolysing)
LHLLPGKLLDIPWARTGARYNQASAAPEDKFSNLNNRYGEWLRRDLREFILDEIGCGALQSLGIFNERSLAMWSRNWPKSNKPKADRLDEKMAWLASLSLFVKKYDIKGIEPPASYGAADWLFQTKAFFHTKLYHAALGVLKR